MVELEGQPVSDKVACVYMVRCADGTLYTGWTNDIEKRLATHNAGQGARYTRARLPVTLVYRETAENESAAKKREYQIKQLTKQQKTELIKAYQEGETTMSYVPTMEQADEILRRYNSEEFHIRHAQIVSGVLRWFAKEHDPENEEFWAVVGLLHDLDFEQYPDEHCVKTKEIMQELDLDEKLIHAVVSHGYKCTETDAVPELYMEKVLYAVDELTGLIGAVAIMRPSKSVGDLELKSVKKKYKQPSFAAGCSRDVIADGAEMMGVELDELIEKTILAMRSMMDEMAI